jgi:hypothetical protein
VQCKAGFACVAGQPIVLSATSTKVPNYPVAAVQTAFNVAASGLLTAGNARLNYFAHATLIGMSTFDAYGGGQSVVQTWEITGTGGLDRAGESIAEVEVVAVIETPKVPANAYAAFATGNTCGAMHFHGNVTIDSYDSAFGTPATTTTPTGGDVGTNGNLTIEGSVAVQGNLSTPRTGVGTCTAGAVTALTESGSAVVGGSMVKLPTAVVYPPPEFSATPPTTTATINALTMAVPATLCTSLGLTLYDPILSPTGTCQVTGTTVIVDGNGVDVTMPNVVVGTGYTLQFNGYASPGQDVNINSLSGTGTIAISANQTAAASSITNESVVLKVAGKNPPGVLSALPDPTDMLVPFNLEDMGWQQNAGANAANKYDASALQIVYPGTGTINMDGGNSQSAASVYAPNADFILKGTQDLFGSILAKTISNGGNASIHYDRRLSRDFWVKGNPMASSFSWKRY